MAEQDKKTLYIFDTAAWIECDGPAGDNRIPIALEKALGDKRLKTPKAVFGELEKPGAISDWAKKNRRKMSAPRGLPPAYARNLGIVQFKYPGMGRAFGTKERADPHVVALAMTYIEGDYCCVVVTAESRNNRPRRKVSGVCDELKIECITLAEFLDREVDDEEE